jgi:hypothetical protein
VALLVLGAALLSAREWGAARALAAAGYRAERDGYVQTFFAARAPLGATPAQVAAAMPRPAVVERYVAPTSGGPDSTLLERFIYRRGLGSWPVHVYYVRGGGVVDVYAQDGWPSLRGARRVTAAEAEGWRAGAR